MAFRLAAWVSCVFLCANAVQLQFWPFGTFTMPSLFHHSFEPPAEVFQIKEQLAYRVNFTEWALNGCSAKGAELRLQYLEVNSLTSMLAAISSEGDEKSLNAALASIDSYKQEIKLCGDDSNQTRLKRASALRSELELAQHHKWMLSHGQDPWGLYAVNLSSNFEPAVGKIPAELSGWFLAKAATVDFVTHKAIETRKGLDGAYLLTDRLLTSMTEALRGFDLHQSAARDPPESVRAKVVMQSLEGHLTLLEAELAAYGAKMPAEYPAAPQFMAESPAADLAIQAIESSLTYAVTFSPFSSTNCSATKTEEDLAGLERSSLTSLLGAVSMRSDLKPVNSGLAKTGELLRSLRACEAFKDETFIARANEVLAELKVAAHHRWMVTNGQDPVGLYALTNESKFAPVSGTAPDKQVEFFLGKVAGLDFFANKAIESIENLDAIYLASSRLKNTMQRAMQDMSSGNKDTTSIGRRAESVIEALQGHVERLQALLCAHGAHQAEWVEVEPVQAIAHSKEAAMRSSEGVLRYNISFATFELEGCSKTQAETRLAEIEEKTLTSLLAVVSFAGDPRTAGSARNCTADLKRAMEACNIDSWKGMIDRVSLIQSEIEAATRHRWMVANGKDQVGLYEVTPVLPATFSPQVNKTAAEKADWFMAKVAIVDFLTHKALESNEGLDNAYALTRVLAVAIDSGINSLGLHKTMEKNTDLKAVRSMLLIKALEQHVFNLREVLREHGVVPPSATN